MKFYIVLAHPELKSFNSSIAIEASQHLKNSGHEVRFNDLCKNEFNPLLSRKDFPIQSNKDHIQFPKAQLDSFNKKTTSNDIKKEHENIEWSDIIILQFPLWLYGMPAILKGWCDRVLSEGFAHKPSENIWFDNSHLNNKKILLSITTNGRRNTFSHNGRHGSLDIILWPIINAFSFSGFKIIKPFIAFDILRISDTDRQSRINEFKGFLDKIHSAKLVNIHSLNDYKPDGSLKDDINSITAGQQKPDNFIK